MRPVQTWTVGIAVLAVLASPARIDAQLSRASGSIATLTPGGIMRGTDVAYDPVNRVYLEVVGNGPVYGVFVNASGQPVTGGFPIFANDSSNWAHFPRVEYAAHANGGAGGFLVTWNHNVGRTNYVFGRMVSYTTPGYLTSGIQLISDSGEGGTWHETGPAMAYSATSQRFLVAWRSIQFGIRGRLIDTNGSPIGGILQLENPGGSRDPAIAWNPATDEFGLIYTGFGGSGALVSFRRIRASDGGNLGRTSFGFSGATFATGIDVNSSNDYVLAWAIHPGTLSTRFDPNGNQLTSSGGTLVTGRFGYDQSLAIAFNAASGTVLAVGSDGQSWEVAGAETNSSGVPISAAQILTEGATPNSGGSFHPMTTARPGDNQWNVVYSRDFRGATNQLVTSGGAASAPSPAPTPSPAPAPVQTPAPSNGCSTSDPFGALGGGVCCTGGWLPPGLSCSTPGSSPAAPSTPAPTPAPTAPSSTCSTPNPFASLGGGTCCSGGWLPPGMACSAPSAQQSVAPAPAPVSSTGCVGSDPFVTIGGGACVNGGWIPRSLVGG